MHDLQLKQCSFGKFSHGKFIFNILILGNDEDISPLYSHIWKYTKGAASKMVNKYIHSVLLPHLTLP